MIILINLNLTPVNTEESRSSGGDKGDMNNYCYYEFGNDFAIKNKNIVKFNYFLSKKKTKNRMVIHHWNLMDTNMREVAFFNICHLYPPNYI